MKQSKFSWPVEELAEYVDSGFVRLDHRIQRGDVWTPIQQSLLIHSAFAGFPIPNLYTIEEDGQLYMLEGKQRSIAFSSFLDNGFRLSKGTPPFRLKSGEQYNAVGQSWNDLPDEIKTKVRTRVLDIFNVFDCSEDEIKELFYRLNNQTKLKAIHKAVARTRSLEQIDVLCNHPLFLEKGYISDKRINGSHHKELAFKSWVSLNSKADDISLTPAKIEQIMSESDISDDSILEIWAIFDYLQGVFECFDGAEAGRKTIENVIETNTTNFPSLVVVAKESMNEGISAGDFANWIQTFFPAVNDANGLSASAEYNANARGNGQSAVKARHSIILNHYRNATLGAERIAI